jgi:peptidoglycan/LPS O-acetylase OafA/YrhL
MSAPKPYLTTLTPLRGIAALVVVIFHSNLEIMAFLPINKPHVITSGWLWVDFFFVLSGFILCYVYSDNFKGSITRATYWKYIKARFARVYPLHFVTMIWCLVCALIVIRYANDLHPFFGDMFRPTAVVPSLFLAQSLGLYISTPLNGPSWSLSTEWWMYMVFPLLVPVFYRLGSLGKMLALTTIAGLFLFVKYYLGSVNFTFPGGSPSLNVVTDYGIFRCMAGFLLGMFLFTLYRESVGYAFFRRSSAFALFFLGTLIAMHFGIEDILVIAIFPFVILSAAYNTTTIKKILDQPFLQRLGDWSFSIYMVHVPIIFIFWIYLTLQAPDRWAAFPPNWSGGSVTKAITLCLVLVVLTLIVASITYKYVEVPARNYLNKKFNPRKLETVEAVN